MSPGIKTLAHKYGSIVRGIFFAISIVLLIAFPLLKTVTLIPINLGVILIVILILLAALTTTAFKWVYVLNAVMSLFGLLLFEFLAFATSVDSNTLVFFIRQAIALSFLITLYLSVRTALAVLVIKDKSTETPTSEPVSGPRKTNQELLEEIKQQRQG